MHGCRCSRVCRLYIHIFSAIAHVHQSQSKNVRGVCVLTGTAYSNASAPVARRRVEAQSAGADDDHAIEEDDVQQVKQPSAAACIHAAFTVIIHSSQTRFTAAHWYVSTRCL